MRKSFFSKAIVAVGVMASAMALSGVAVFAEINIELKNSSTSTVPVGDDQNDELEELLEDTQLIPIEDQVADSALVTEFEKVLSSLTAREERAIRLRFGIGGEDEHTLKQVGEILGLTVERVRQIEHEAMRKMRQPNRAKRLKLFLL